MLGPARTAERNHSLQAASGGFPKILIQNHVSGLWWAWWPRYRASVTYKLDSEHVWTYSFRGCVLLIDHVLDVDAALRASLVDLVGDGLLNIHLLRDPGGPVAEIELGILNHEFRVSQASRERFTLDDIACAVRPLPARYARAATVQLGVWRHGRDHTAAAEVLYDWVAARVGSEAEWWTGGRHFDQLAGRGWEEICNPLTPCVEDTAVLVRGGGIYVSIVGVNND